MIENFTPASATLGGLMIGLAASLLLYGTGHVAGVSSVFGGLLQGRAGDVDWRLAFVGGLVVGGFLLLLVYPGAFAVAETRSLGLVAAGGLAVGVGTRMGSGCTSGHGICGLARGSERSAAAVATFMATGFATAMLLHLLGATS